MVRGQAPILLRGQVKKNDTAQWRRWGKKSKVLKPSLVTASYSAALGTLRKQTWRNKSISFKSFLFQSFQLVGHFVSLDLRSLLSRVLLDSSQANLFPVFFCDWLISSVLMPKPLFPLCQPRFIISFKSSTELPWWSSAENLPANAGDTGLIPAPGELQSWTCVPQLLSWRSLEPLLHNKSSRHNAKPMRCN